MISESLIHIYQTTETPAEFNSNISLDKSKINVGLIWQGNPDHARDRMRSIPLDSFSTLFNTGNTQFYSLQVDQDCRTELSQSSHSDSLIDAGQHLNDFNQTAALINQLDLVITVDTAVVHLAGALLRPTWLLIDSVPDWRWQTERTDSPWYPGVKIFRQKEWGNWREVIEQVQNELSKFEKKP